MDDVFAPRELAELNCVGPNPVAPRLERGDLGFDLVVFDDSTRRGVDDEHATRLEATLSDHLRGVDVVHADLGRHDDEPVVRHEETSGSKPVAIEGRASDRSVGEGEGRGAVPRFHERRVIPIEVATTGFHGVIVLPRLGDHHHDRVWERPTREFQQLNDLVKRRGIACPLGDNREERCEITESVRIQLRLSRAHPVAVRAHGVDLSVVRDESERLGEGPRRKGVGGKARVHERKFRFHAHVREVGEERFELQRRNHALIDEGTARKRREIGSQFSLGTFAQTECESVESDAAR